MLAHVTPLKTPLVLTQSTTAMITISDTLYSIVYIIFVIVILIPFGKVILEGYKNLKDWANEDADRGEDEISSDNTQNP